MRSFVQDGAADQSPEAEEEFSGNSVEKRLELGRGRGGLGPGKAQLGAEPGEGRADQPGADEITPAPEAPLGDDFLPGSGVEGPLGSGFQAVTVHSEHGFDHRADREPAPPNFGRNQGSGGSITENSSEDGQVLEPFPGGQIGGALAVSNPMPAGTPPVSTSAATKPHGLGQRPHVLDRTDRCPVGGQPQCEYTLDSDPWFTTSQPSVVVFHVLRCGLRLRGTKCRTSRSPQRLFLSHQSDSEKALAGGRE